jgi:hypothetical protein
MACPTPRVVTRPLGLVQVLVPTAPASAVNRMADAPGQARGRVGRWL